MHDRLGCWVDSVNQEINTSWKTKNKMDIISGYGNDYLPWLYTQPLQIIGGC
jgi:hypothetical protein